ncbi:cytochrome c biogenesis CcdA family protein [Halomicroarcula sp. GCM10025894]|uniref:cytochrome c biogenesis CcdA family protein n=1 Tax=Halomicroarcula sp. GCM10025894 TaxID=3252673 RepID=UPI0036060443
MTAGATLAFAFGAGLASFVSPCVFPLLPGYVAYYADQHGGRASTRPMRQGTAAAAGVLTVFAALTVGVYAVGSRLVASVAGLEPAVGALLIALGLVTVVDRAPSIRVSLPRRRNTLPGVFAFGAVYAVAAVGCTVPLLLAVVAQALAMARSPARQSSRPTPWASRSRCSGRPWRWGTAQISCRAVSISPAPQSLE